MMEDQIDRTMEGREYMEWKNECRENGGTRGRIKENADSKKISIGLDSHELGKVLKLWRGADSESRFFPLLTCPMENIRGT